VNDALDFLRVPPYNRLEQLRGDRAGQRSIHINDQWRNCFRLARYFSTTPQSWLNLQKNYELEVAKRTAGRIVAAEVSPRSA
jgi:hypothetical protein